MNRFWSARILLLPTPQCRHNAARRAAIFVALSRHPRGNIDRSFAAFGEEVVFIATEQPAFRATAFRLTDVEREKLWRIFGAVDRNLARVATAMLGFPSIADSMDIVQESFMSFARQAIRGGLRCLGNRRIADVANSELDERIPLCRAYLIRVVVCKCRWYYRQKKLDPIGATVWVNEHIRGRKTSPAEALNRQEVVNAVRRAILTLPKHLQKVLTLPIMGDVRMGRLRRHRTSRRGR